MAAAHHFVCWVQSHGDIEKVLVQKGDARLQAKGERSLVGAHDIVLM